MVICFSFLFCHGSQTHPLFLYLLFSPYFPHFLSRLFMGYFSFLLLFFTFSFSLLPNPLFVSSPPFLHLFLLLVVSTPHLSLNSFSIDITFSSLCFSNRLLNMQIMIWFYFPPKKIYIQSLLYHYSQYMPSDLFGCYTTIIFGSPFEVSHNVVCCLHSPNRAKKDEFIFLSLALIFF